MEKLFEWVRSAVGRSFFVKRETFGVSITLIIDLNENLKMSRLFVVDNESQRSTSDIQYWIERIEGEFKRTIVPPVERGQ